MPKLTVSRADEILGGQLVFGDPSQIEAVKLQEAAEKLRRLWRKHPHLVPGSDGDPLAGVGALLRLRGQTMEQVSAELARLNEIVNFDERTN